MKQRSKIDCNDGLPALWKPLNPPNCIVSEFYYNENCYISAYTENRPRALGYAEDGARGCEAGEEGGFLVSPDVAQPCLLVASVRAGLRAQRAVKLKAAAQSGLLPRVCIQPSCSHTGRASFLGERFRK